MQQEKIVVSIGIVALVTVIALSTLGVWAAAATVVEPKMNYQGRLLDSSGDPVDDIVTMSFRLYNVPTGGTALWSENKTVQVVNGLFNTNLSYLDVGDFDQALWLEIIVEGDILSPRQQLLGAPYAFSLVPGAVVSDSQWSPLLTVNNSWGDGVRGLSGSGTGGFFDGYYGVWGNGSYGVIGHGVYYGGYFWSDEGDGVYAISYGSDSSDDGVYAYSSNGNGVYAYSPNYYGVYGVSASHNHAAIQGNSTRGIGVKGVHTDPSYTSPGVHGKNTGSGAGVVGDRYDSSSGTYSGAIIGRNYGNGYGIEGISTTSYGVYGDGYFGVYGDGTAYGGYFKGGSSGVHGGGGSGYGVHGWSDDYIGGYFGTSDANSYGVYSYGDLRVIGDITKTGTVSFVEGHPEDPTKEIVYVCLEGGEAGTYTRGSAQLTNGKATVNLPEHFSMVTSSEGLTAQVTPTANCNGLYVAEKSNSTIVVKELNDGASDATFDYLVNGIRKGYENYQAIQDKKPAIIDAGPAPEFIEEGEKPSILPETGPVQEPVVKEPVPPPELSST